MYRTYCKGLPAHIADAHGAFPVLVAALTEQGSRSVVDTLVLNRIDSLTSMATRNSTVDELPE